MLRSVDVGCGAYGAAGPAWIARWTLVDGWPRCVEAPLSIADTDPAELARQVAMNRAITALLEQVERYEAAVRLLDAYANNQVPERWVTQAAAWNEWQAAQAVVAAATADILWLAETRAGAASIAGGYTLILPPVPALDDPCTQTADLVDGVWGARSLTDMEAQTWPLRRRPALGKLAFAQLLGEVLGEAASQAILSTFGVTLSLAADIDFDDVFRGGTGGPSYADQLVTDGVVTAANVTALRRRWPLG